MLPRGYLTSSDVNIRATSLRVGADQIGLTEALLSAAGKDNVIELGGTLEQVRFDSGHMHPVIDHTLYILVLVWTKKDWVTTDHVWVRSYEHLVEVMGGNVPSALCAAINETANRGSLEWRCPKHDD